MLSVPNLHGKCTALLKWKAACAEIQGRLFPEPRSEIFSFFHSSAVVFICIEKCVSLDWKLSSDIKPSFVGLLCDPGLFRGSESRPPWFVLSLQKFALKLLKKTQPDVHKTTRMKVTADDGDVRKCNPAPGPGRYYTSSPLKHRMRISRGVC